MWSFIFACGILPALCTGQATNPEDAELTFKIPKEESRHQEVMTPMNLPQVMDRASGRIAKVMDTLIDQLKGLEDGARAMYGVSTKWNSQDNANAVETAAVYYHAVTDIRKMSNPKVYDALKSFYRDVLPRCQDVQTYAQYVCKKVNVYVFEALGPQGLGDPNLKWKGKWKKQ